MKDFDFLGLLGMSPSIVLCDRASALPLVKTQFLAICLVKVSCFVNFRRGLCSGTVLQFTYGSAFILVGWIRIRIRTGNTDPDQDPGGPKLTTKVKNLKFSSARCSVLRDEDFSCSVDILYDGLGISKSQFLI
jgi:hypothetical protein